MSDRVGILVGGGDVPGLNVCLKSLVYRLVDEGLEPIGIRLGWEGLLNYNFDDRTSYGANFIELTKSMVRRIDHIPGSFLHASRFNPQKAPSRLVPKFLREPAADTQDLTPHLKAVVQHLGYRALVVIGDNETLQYAAYLSQEGLPIVAIPKTIHNNIWGTDYTVGFSTGLARGVAFIHELQALAASREQVVVVETFGGGSGLSSLMTAFLAGVERAIIPEVPYDPEKLAWLVKLDKNATLSNSAVVTISDGSRIVLEKLLQYTPSLSPRSQSAVLRMMTEEEVSRVQNEVGREFTLAEVVETGSSLVGSGMVAAELLGHLLGEELFLQPLTYLLRTGPPDGQDLMLATNFAILAAELVKKRRYGRMTTYYQRYYLTDIDLNIVTRNVKNVDVDEMYDVENYQPKLNLIWATQMVKTH